MATLQFTVFETAAEVALGDPIQENIITISGTSAQGAVIAAEDGKRRRVRVAVDTNCWVLWSENPTALVNGTAGRMMFAGDREYFDIQSGHRIAVIERT